MKRETTMAFLAGVAVTGAFLAGMGMGQQDAKRPLRYVALREAGGICQYSLLREDGVIYNYCQGAWSRSTTPAPTVLP